MADLNQTEIAEIKAQLRREILARRDALPPSARAAAASAIAARPFPVSVSPGVTISGFYAIKSEISPFPLMRRLAESGAHLALPVIAGRGQPLTLRAWTFGAPLNAGVWGIREPPPEAPEVFPDIVLAPLLAFDRGGRRLGYGAGYYDMTIARLRKMKRITVVGVCFAVQEVPAVPVTPRDERLDLVLTENDVIDCREV